MELVSIIVPVYNVEEYLQTCLDSLLAQSFKNIEILLIDDGSTDNSREICDNYCKLDKRVTVIHKQNRGLADARNTGIQKSKGSFLMFVDSDDYIDCNCVEKALTYLHSKHLDIACYSGFKFNGTKIIEPCFETKYSGMVVNGKTVAKDILIDKIGSQVVVGLYKKDLFNNICFPVGRLYEDIPTTYRLFYNANRVGFMNEPFYYYRVNSRSISHAYNPLVPYHLFLGFLDHYLFAIKNDLEVKYECLIKAAHFATSTCFHYYTWKNKTLKNCVFEAESFLKDNKRSLIKDKTMLKSRRVMMKIFLRSKFFFQLICMVIRIFKWKEQ